MKSILFASLSIQTGYRQSLMCGGFESMSNVPYYLPKGRSGMRYGHGEVLDGLIFDGLWDVYNNQHMGMCGEVCADKFKIGREEQDKYARRSYERAAEAWKNGYFKDEVVPVSVAQKKGDPIIVKEDEQYTKVDFTKFSKLPSAFKQGGTITAANASPLNDGASALVVMSAGRAKEKGIKPLAKILGFGDAECAPVDFTIAPSLAVPLALKNAGIKITDVDYWEINEAFSVVALVNKDLLKIDVEKVNVNGGAVALGHPIGSSGARIVVSLINILKNRNGKIGVAAICNGGGGASAIVIERL